MQAVIPYSELPGFPVSSVEGHAGQLVCGSMGDLPVACYQGRVHMYEGGNPQDLRCPTYALKLIGCDALVVTSAVGSLRPEVGPGELVCVTDHINMQPASPLVGVNDEIGPRFTSMVDAYDPSLRAALHAAAERSTVKLHDGVFLATMGPMFETPAEIKAYRCVLGTHGTHAAVVGWGGGFLTRAYFSLSLSLSLSFSLLHTLRRTLGADVVGMSCVVEMTVNIYFCHCILRLLLL